MKRTFISTHLETTTADTVAVAAAACTAVALAISVVGAILGVAAFLPFYQQNVPTVVGPSPAGP